MKNFFRSSVTIGLMLLLIPLQGSAVETEEEFKAALDVLMQDHVTLTLKSLREDADEAASHNQTLQDLQANTDDISENIIQIYDLQSGTDFLEIWRLRLIYFADYLYFLETDNTVGKSAALSDLESTDEGIATLLATLVDGFSESSARSQLSSITNLFLASTEDYVDGNVAAATAKEATAKTQIGVLSSSLGDGIAADLILTQPEPEETTTETTTETNTETSTNSNTGTTGGTTVVSSTNTGTSTSSAPSTTSAASSTTTTDESATDVGTTNVTSTEEVATETTATATTETTPEVIVFPFPDVDESDDYAAIADVKTRSIVGGYPDGTYRPDISINRAEFTKIVVGAVNSNPFGSNCFPDVAQEWFAAPVCTAQAQNIVGGYPDGTFKPGNTVNAAEAYKIVAETLFPGEAATTTVWYQGYLNLAIAKGFYLGSDLSVSAEVTRGQMASIISRALAAQEG